MGRWRQHPGDVKAVKKQLSHYNASGDVSMVDVSAKEATKRTAIAKAHVVMAPSVIKALPSNKKGDPLQVARIAGISAAKKTSELIPLCHQIPLSHIGVEFEVKARGIDITATATTVAQTGVEMEAMTAAAVAALTLYDMTKALDKAIEIREIYLIEKTGGKSGTYRRRRHD
jgi:cyclic pyranopterin monophosphate synthase